MISWASVMFIPYLWNPLPSFPPGTQGPLMCFFDSSCQQHFLTNKHGNPKFQTEQLECSTITANSDLACYFKTRGESEKFRGKRLEMHGESVFVYNTGGPTISIKENTIPKTQVDLQEPKFNARQPYF